MIKVGILGCANIAKRSLIPAFAAHAEFDVVAIASRTPEKAAELASQYHCRACDYDGLIAAKDVELIYCPLPTGLHHEWVKKALMAGKHVLCEKSLACNLSEAEDLVATARANDRFLMESFQFRFHAQNLYVKELLAQGAVGPLRQVVVRFGIPPFPEGVKNIRYSAALGGGALLDNGAYTIKCTTYLLGSDVKVLSAMEGGEDPTLGNVPLTGSIMMSANGVPVQTAYGFDHFYQNSYEIWGKEGKISTVRAFTAREDFAAPVVLETKSGREEKTFNDDHFARLMDYVSESVLSGEYENEYNECLVQARLIDEVRTHEIR